MAAFVVAALAADAGGYSPTTWGWSAIVLLLAGGLACASGARRLAPLELTLPTLLASFAGWVWLSLAWSTDVAETVHEGERTLVYVAATVALLLLGRRSRVEPLLALVATAIVAVCAYALAIRLLAPGRAGYQVLSAEPDAAFRLARPIGYANALGIFAVLGILLALGFGLRGRGSVARGLASSALVVLFPTLYFTYGRGAWIALAVGLVALLAGERVRFELVGRTLALLAAPALAVALASRTHGLTREPGSLAAATHDGRRLAVALVALALVAALVPAGVDWVGRRLVVARPVRRALAATLVLLLVSVAAALVVDAGGPGAAARRAYRAFNAPAPLVGTDTSRRLFSLSGNSRSEYWQVAWRESELHPWLGGGAGSYQRFWFTHRRSALPVRDAHSLYLETLAELGPVGLALLVCALAVPLLAARDARRRPLAPAALGAYVAYLVHAGIDWDWEMTAVTLAALCCGVALLLAARGDDGRPLWPAARALGAVVATALCVAALLGFVGNRAEAAADDALDRADPTAAETQARHAKTWEPWSAEPWRLLGDAQLELGRVDQARTTFLDGLAKDSGNWELWLDLALASNGEQRRDALLNAARLNPLSPELRSLQRSP